MAFCSWQLVHHYFTNSIDEAVLTQFDATDCIVYAVPFPQGAKSDHSKARVEYLIDLL